MKSIYGHILWDDFASRFNSQAKILELAKVFPYSSAPRDYCDRKEIIENNFVVKLWNLMTGSQTQKHVKTRYIRFEELQDWTPGQIAFAGSKGITIDGNSEQHNVWLNEYEDVWRGEDEDVS
jgi:hypothetical protein